MNGEVVSFIARERPQGSRSSQSRALRVANLHVNDCLTPSSAFTQTSYRMAETGRLQPTVSGDSWPSMAAGLRSRAAI